MLRRPHIAHVACVGTGRLSKSNKHIQRYIIFQIFIEETLKLIATIATKILSVITAVQVAATQNACYYYMSEVSEVWEDWDRLRRGSSRSLCLSFGFV